MSTPDSVRALAQLGFTNLEAEVYAFLVGESPATGYRIAQAIGKPAANTYKAIQTLERKGAVVVEDGASRQCRAISVDELLGRMSREFQDQRDRAARALRELGQPRADDRVYQIRSTDALLQRLRQMLVEAKKVVLGAMPSHLYHELREEIATTASRGVDIVLRVDSLDEIPGVELISHPEEPGMFWRELRVVVDAEQHLAAYVSSGGELLSAVWSGSLFLSVSHHRGLAAELNQQVLAGRIRDEAGPKRLAKALAQHRDVQTTPGYRMLFGVEEVTKELALESATG